MKMEIRTTGYLRYSFVFYIVLPRILPVLKRAQLYNLLPVLTSDVWGAILVVRASPG